MVPGIDKLHGMGSNVNKVIESSFEEIHKYGMYMQNCNPTECRMLLS